MFEDYNSVEENLRDLGFNAGKMIMKGHSPEEVERLVNIFVEATLKSIEEFAEFDNC